MTFEPGKWYRFHPESGTGKHLCSPYAKDYNALTLKYLRDELGEQHRKQRVIHHIFQWRGGALECFTDEQLEDYRITKK